MLQRVHDIQQELMTRHGEEHFQRIVSGLRYWLDICEQGHLTWAVWRFDK